MHRTTVYRLLKRVQSEGEKALTDERHGHPVKLRGEALTVLMERCQTTPCVSSPVLQRLLQEHLGLCISVSQRESRPSQPRAELVAAAARKKAQKRLVD